MDPQILPEHPLGKLLIDLAAQSQTVVEVGTGGGRGSTQCLIQGLLKSTCGNNCLLVTIEADKDRHTEAQAVLKDSPVGIEVVHGVLHRTISPYYHPLNRVQDREHWQFENALKDAAPLVSIDTYVRDIDLLFLDGGEFTSDGDFLALWQRAKVIVLDDAYRMVARKNVVNWDYLHSGGWDLFDSNLADRNGWAAFRRPA